MTQILIGSLILVKIVLGSIFLYQVEQDPLSLDRTALASEPKKETEPPKEENNNKKKKRVKREKTDWQFLVQKRIELRKKEENLAKKRLELEGIQKEIKKEIQLLTKLRNEIRAEMAKKKAAQTKKVKHLIKAYSAMKPQKAAGLVEKLDTAFAIALLSKMKGDAVGNILSFLDTEKAAKISEGLVTQK